MIVGIRFYIARWLKEASSCVVAERGGECM